MSCNAFRIAIAGGLSVALTGIVTPGVGAATKDVASLLFFEDASVARGASELVRDGDAEAVSARIDASNLLVGGAYTYWWVIFNRPENCSPPGCGIDDIENPDGSLNEEQIEAARVAVLGGNGEVADSEGRATFTGTLLVNSAEGHDVLIGPGGIDLGFVDWLLEDAETAEIHIVIRNHGPALSGEALDNQLNTFGGNCEGIDPEGEFECVDEQFAVHAIAFRQLFAEGAVGSFFNTDVGFFNASRDEVANVRVTLFPETPDEPVELELTLDPLTRVTVDLNEELDDLEGGVSTRVESDQPIAGLRTMLWDGTSYGGHIESGQPTTSLRWFFGEGATSLFDLFYLLENENDAEANVTLTYLRGAGQGPPVVQNVVVPANARQTILANTVPGLESADVSAVIESDLPIVAERAMYLSGPRAFEAGHVSAGATELSTTWNIAEGASTFFDPFLFFGNPNDDEALVTVTYLLPDGSTVVTEHQVPAMTKLAVFVAGEDPMLADTEFAATVSSTVPIVAERAMWWGPDARFWYEANASLGTTEAGTVFGIGEAKTGGPTEDDTFVLLSNASADAAPVGITLIYDDGTTEETTVTLASSSRRTLLMTTEFPDSEGQRFSILVESLDEVPINVEASRFQSTEGIFGNAGGSAQATKIQ